MKKEPAPALACLGMSGAKQNFRKYGMLKPCVVFQWPNGHREVVFIAFPYDDDTEAKEAFAKMVIARLEDGVREVIFTCEMWTVFVPDGEKPLDADGNEPEHVRDMPGAKEVLHVHYENADGAVRVWNARITRMGKPKAHAWREVTDEGKRYGRFENFFKRAQAGRARRMN